MATPINGPLVGLWYSPTITIVRLGKQSVKGDDLCTNASADQFQPQRQRQHYKRLMGSSTGIGSATFQAITVSQSSPVANHEGIKIEWSQLLPERGINVSNLHPEDNINRFSGIQTLKDSDDLADVRTHAFCQ
ncbi:hypothetical protein BD410DRAFT_807217 [Rickenella mellea]|uniref:Uncharacterized protein n=1 Tax=Rickenella mellea TaxID=50990 RepID=A0A4Y7PR83_9AGAM|nr:hypothetical protein BD410DRAFT_807217 [Rickenella mellea]